MGFAGGFEYEDRPFKYWAQLAAHRLVMEIAKDPETVMDALFEPIQSPGFISPSRARDQVIGQD